MCLRTHILNAGGTSGKLKIDCLITASQVEKTENSRKLHPGCFFYSNTRKKILSEFIWPDGRGIWGASCTTKCWALPVTLLLLLGRCSRQRIRHPGKMRSCVWECEVWAWFLYRLPSQRRMEVRSSHPSLEKTLNAMSGRRAILRNSKVSWRKSKGWGRTSVTAFVMQSIDTRAGLEFRF